MKTIPPPCPEPETGPKYWRSLEHLADTPEFRTWVEREFPAGASEFTDPVSRRHFVQIMSASFLLAGLGLTGCRRPEEHILPFSQKPEGFVHGVPQYFASARPVRGSAVPVIVKSHDGRPVKLEGNAEHPLNQLADRHGTRRGHGGTDRQTQASILSLYDPDRAMRCTRDGQNARREAAVDALSTVAKEAATHAGDGLAFLLERSSSPTRERLQASLRAKYPKARWFTHEPVDFDVHRRAATRAFGTPVRPFYQLEQARTIVALDSDFLGAEEEVAVHIRRFAAGRRLEGPHDRMSRLYAIEGLYTLTGAQADHRLRVAPSQVGAVAALLFAELIDQARIADQDARAGDFAKALREAGQGAKVDPQWIAACVKDCLAHPGESVWLAGYRQPLAVHLLAHAFNASLGSAGRAVQYLPAPEPQEGGLAELAEALRAGQVHTLISLGGNPAYTAPADVNWADAVAKAKTVIRLGYYEDESFPTRGWHLPQAHFLESWGDARTADGTWVPVQPLLEPLFGGFTELEVLARAGGLDQVKPYDLVRETFRAQGEGDAEAWKKFLHDGYRAGSAPAPVPVKVDWDQSGPAILAGLTPAGGESGLEVVFHRDYRVDDGRDANNGWLQELPDPVTKLTWENVVLLSAATAATLNLKIEDKNDNNLRVPLVSVRVGGREVSGPAWIQPGLADGVVALALGYGRTRAGRVGNGAGYNAYTVRTDAAPYLVRGATVTATGATHPLAVTQNHWAMEGRPVIREATLAEYQAQPRFAQRMNMEEPPGPKDPQGRPMPLYPNPLDALQAKAAHAWGMSIDLGACVGCSACMVACQSENNIPIVGKDQVSRQREMHWLRLDRYYAGDPADPQMVTQPMLCQHCEAAPCESVCPVNATVHDAEGLNLMVYNRCVGTRYCSNNCPYKVRRFNFFDYHKRSLDQLKGPFYSTPVASRTDGEWTLKRWFKSPERGTRPDDDWELAKLAKNPEVSVRMRGVMEKCTFCLQRIEAAKIARKVKARDSGEVRLSEADGTVPQTACQQACPAEAIHFGDLKDPASRVSKLRASDRTYSVLEFLLTKPRTTYLARVRNPNPALPGSYAQPYTTQEYLKKNPPVHGAHAAPEGPETHGTHTAPHSGEKGAH